jgi:hypothetical protein
MPKGRVLETSHRLRNLGPETTLVCMIEWASVHLRFEDERRVDGVSVFLLEAERLSDSLIPLGRLLVSSFHSFHGGGCEVIGNAHICTQYRKMQRQEGGLKRRI